MAEEARRRKLPLWLRIALGVVIAVFALVALGIGLRYWITSDSGRAFVASQIDGRKIGPLGTIRLSGLKGDPLTAASFADIALVDDEDVWLRAKDARIEWTPTALFGGELVIAKIDVRSVDVIRPPHVTQLEQDNGSAPDIGINLDKITIADLHLAPAVIGSDAHYAVGGGIVRRRDSSGNARLMLTPVSGPADRANISAEWSATAALKAAATLDGPAGGLIASLINAPEDKSVGFTGRLDGSIDQFTGNARLAFDDEQVATLTLTRRGTTAQLNADVLAGSWPLLAPLAERAGDDVKLNGQANLADLKSAPTTLQIVAKAGTLNVGANLDLNDLALNGPLQVSSTQLDLAMVASPLAGKLDASGQLALDGADFTWKGDAIATNIVWPSGGASRLSAPLTVSKEGSTISWTTPAAVIEGGRVDALKSLAPARYTASTRGEVNLKAQTVDIFQSQIVGAPGNVSARGSYRISNGAIDFDGTARFNRLADVAPLTGSAGSQWSVKRTSTSAPIRITANAQGRDVSSPIASLANIAGPEPRVVLSAVVRDGRFAIESGSLRGAGINADMTGRVTDNGRITGSANGVLTRPLDLSGATVDDLAFTADISGDLDAPHIDLRLSDGAIAVGGLDFTNAGGRAQATLGQAVRGDFNLTARSGDNAFTAKGRILGGEGEWRIANLDAALGKLQVKAPRLAYSAGVFDASFTAAGPLNGIGGIERGTINVGGDISIGEDLAMNLTGRLSNLRSGGLHIDLATFDGDASGDTTTMKGQARGNFGAPFDLKWTANGVRQADSWSGQSTLDGSIDQLPITTSRPATWSYSASAWNVDTSLSAFGGSLAAVLATGESGASAKLDLADLSLRGISRLARVTPIDGKISGTLSFTNGPGPAQGDFRIAIANANPVGVTADPISFTTAGQLRDHVLTATASGEGQGFKLAASSREPMIIGHGFDVRPDPNAPMQAQFDMTGRAEQLWALFGPEDQAFRGQLQAKVSASGTIAKPTLEGGFSIADGAYEHAETGLRLRDIAANAVFDQNSVRITTLTANDGHGGTASGQGAIRWNAGVSGGLNFSAEGLRALARDDRSATVSGNGSITLDDSATNVTGKFTISQARISIEQPASAAIPTLPGLRRVNFPNQTEEDEKTPASEAWFKPVRLDVNVDAPRRIVVFGRGLDTEWSANLHITGTIEDPAINGTATLVRGDLDLAGHRFAFDTGSIDLNGPIRLARIDISAERTADDITASVHVTGTPVDPKFTLESTPSLPQDEILARVLFGRSAAELSGFEAAQLAAGLAELAGGQAGFNPVSLVRKATGLDRVSFGAEGGIATVSAGKYIADDVYLQVGAGGSGGVGAEVEWEPQKNLSIVSSAQGNGDTKIAIRWKKDY